MWTGRYSAHSALSSSFIQEFRFCHFSSVISRWHPLLGGIRNCRSQINSLWDRLVYVNYSDRSSTESEGVENRMSSLFTQKKCLTVNMDKSVGLISCLPCLREILFLRLHSWFLFASLWSLALSRHDIWLTTFEYLLPSLIQVTDIEHLSPRWSVLTTSSVKLERQCIFRFSMLPCPTSLRSTTKTLPRSGWISTVLAAK